jgi:hypothetical protein
VPVDVGSEGAEGSEGSAHPGGEAFARDAAPPAPQPAPHNPRQVRARRRRRRRQIGTILFVLVAIGVFATAYFAVAGGDDDSSDDGTAARSGVTTTVAPPFVATYKVTTGINVRQTPSTTSPTVAVIEQGRDVTVVCVVDAEVVNAPSGPNPQWLRVAGPWNSGYVSAAFVSTGDDLRAGEIPACPT